MKVICDRSALVEIFTIVGAAIATRTPKPALQCIKITASGGKLTLAGTDMEVALRVSTDRVQIEEEGQVLLPADKLQHISRESGDDTLVIESDDDKSVIRGSDSKFTIYGFPPGEFPAIPESSNMESDFQIKAGQLRSLIDRTLFATARENSRYAINGVLLKHNDKKIDMVATDGRRLAYTKGLCTSKFAGEHSCIIPSKALNLLMKLTDEADRFVDICIKGNQVIFSVSDDGERDSEFAMLASNLVEGTFPPYEDVIPKDMDKKVTFNVDILASAVRRAALLTNEESKGVRLAFTSDKLTISSRAPELGEAEIEVALESYEGDDIAIGFNPSFITEALKKLDTPEITLELTSPSKPGLIRSGSDFQYVIMPVSL